MSENQYPENYIFISNHDFTEVLQNNKTGHKGLFALNNFKNGEILLKFDSSKIVDRPNYLTVQISDTQHIHLFPEFLQYINHSCNPNVLFNTDTMVLECVKEIFVGDELSFFYPATEWNMAQSFTCFCQQKNCIGQIAGALNAPKEILSRYKLTAFIKNKLAEREA
jgi:hypothetical protein